MLRWRLLLGTVFISALVGLVWADVHYRADGIIVTGVAMFLAFLATQEYLTIIRMREPELDGGTLYIGNLSLVAAPLLTHGKLELARFGSVTPGDAVLAAFTVAMLAMFLFEIGRYDKDVSKNVTERPAFTALGLFYVGVLMSFVVRLYLDNGSIFPLVSMLVVVKMADIGAYTVGRLIGKHKLAPKLSPGKTIEGLCGGLAFSILGALAVAWAFGKPLFFELDTEPFGWALVKATIVYALVVGATGVVGDLVESLLKRDFGRKDSSTWMPGFGGVLDILDSPLLAAPVAWAFWHWGWMR